MRTSGDELAYSRGPSKRVLGYCSGSFLQSLITALLVGVIAALLGMAAGAALYYRHVAWYISAGAGPIVDTVVVIILATIALEQSRKRSIRRTLELAFLNHHVRNALTQIMASSLTNARDQEYVIRAAVNRISEALFRVEKSADLRGLSLEVDLGGVALAHEAKQRSEKTRRG